MPTEADAAFEAVGARPTPALARMLALSAALHLALVQLVSITPGATVPYTWVVNARLTGADAGAVPPAMPRGPVKETSAPPPRSAPVVPRLEAIPMERALPTEAPPAGVPEVRPGPAMATASMVPGAASAPMPPPSVPLPPAKDALATLDAPADNHWYETRALDVPPKAVAAPRPIYPDAARRAGLEGAVVLGLRIDETGTVRDARVLSATPPGVFDAAALAAYAGARFTPARLQGRAVRAEVRLRAVFRLEDE